MIPSYELIHNAFKINGVHYDKEQLMQIAYDYVKEGEPYEQAIGDFLIDWLNPLTHVDVKTSGSTGEPKVIRLDKQKMVHSAVMTGDKFGITVGDSALHCLPADFIAGKMMFVRAMILGLNLDMVKPTADPLKFTDKHYRFAAMIPLQASHCFEQLGQIEILLLGGAPIPYKLLLRIQETPAEVYETYGMTETITHIAVRKLNHFKPNEDFDQRFFRTLPDVEIEADDRGCLIIHSPSIAEEPVVTNDLVRIVSSHEFEWIGRLDNVINSGGVKLIPELLEPLYSKVIDRRFVLVGIPDADLGQQAVLIIEGKEMDKQKIMTKLSSLESLGKYDLPKELFFLPKLPETENGKVIRKEALEMIMSPNN